MNTLLRAVSDWKGGCRVRNSWNGTKKEPPECRTYTVEDIAHILGVIGRTSGISSRAGRTLFKSVRIGNAIRISKRSFDEWLESLDL